MGFVEERVAEGQSSAESQDRAAVEVFGSASWEACQALDVGMFLSYPL
jgi:hypothetical protein